MSDEPAVTNSAMSEREVMKDMRRRHHNEDGICMGCLGHDPWPCDVAVLLSTIQDHEGHIENLGFLLTKRTEERDNALIRLSEQQRVIEAVRALVDGFEAHRWTIIGDAGSPELDERMAALYSSLAALEGKP